ncbi:MAG: 54S ribosomal protein, mitochondrial [Icmadophila ericetorum]|nr:54S ribosomal protein, mitochondrial [Icmadophila ericetorum]
MSTKLASTYLRYSKGATTLDPLMQCLTPRLSRSMATETQMATSEASPPPTPIFVHNVSPVAPDVLATIYRFPSMEPLRFTNYPANRLHLPLRRDILHRAIVFEGDATRQGTASTKWRGDVHGSNRKIRPQKGTGRARLGDKKSPMLKGGGVAFGPHPRDFSTKLPKKLYDQAWRMALSYRYRRGELIVVEDGVEIELNEPRWIKQIMEKNHWGNANGRSLIVTQDLRPNLFEAIAGSGEDGLAKTEDDVDVKDLLELGRIIIEKGALDSILKDHSSDLDRTVPSAVLY